MSASLALLAMP